MNTKRILVFLIPIFIASLIYGYLQMPHQERISATDGLDTPAKKKEPKQRAAVNRNEGYPRLRSDLLERKSQPYSGVHRDLFFAGFATDQYEEENSAAPFEAPSEVIVPPVVVPVAPPPPPPTQLQIAQQELSRYKFLGFFEKREHKTIFLSTDGEVFLLREGESLGKSGYTVLNVTDSTLELRKRGVGDFSIQLTDQENLSAVSSPGQREVEPSRPEDPDEPIQVKEDILPGKSELIPESNEDAPVVEQLQPEEE